jgi:hypothetical protein
LILTPLVLELALLVEEMLGVVLELAAVLEVLL